MVDNWPQSRGDALERNLKGLEKLRAGNYRIIYRVSGEMITIERIGDRKDVYGHGD
jgi:mRNA-degrading endonuclease RelE of RelBE toxin-antitoxin system